MAGTRLETNTCSTSASSYQQNNSINNGRIRYSFHVRPRKLVLPPIYAAEQDLDWEPDLRRKGPLIPPSKNSYRPPPPPPPPQTVKSKVPDGPFKSRRDLAVTVLAGSGLLWLWNNKLGIDIKFADKPDIPFDVLGYTDMRPEDFVYFKTPGGHWVATGEDDQGRMFMIDEIGDLYYDSGDPRVGLYAMDTEGNLFNFYIDAYGERKITPVGNVGDLRSFKISEIAGVKLDNDVNVVAFQDGRSVQLPAGAEMVTKDGEIRVPGELVEGIPDRDPNRARSRLPNFFGNGAKDRRYDVDRFELDLQDPTPFGKQMLDQVLLDDPDEPGFQVALPDDFDLAELMREVEEEKKKKKK